MNKSHFTKLSTPVLLLIFICLTFNHAFAQKQNSFTVTGGIAIPNSEITNIFNSSFVTTKDTNNPIYSLVFPESSNAYTLSAKFSLPLSENVNFLAGFGLVRFKELKYDLRSAAQNEYKGYLLATTSIYMISASVNYYILNDIINIYGIGSLAYNFLSNKVNTNFSQSPLNIAYNPTDSRLGFTVGMGLEIPLEQLALVIEPKYCELNYIGKSSQEKSKSIYMIEAGIKF